MASVNQPETLFPITMELEQHTETPDEGEGQRKSDARPEIFRSTAQEILFIFIATMSLAVPSFLQGSTLVVSFYIQRDLDMTTSQLTWMTASSA
jgi:hypothetical protein